MILPVPLKTLPKGRHALAAPVLAPDAGNFDSMFQRLFKKVEGTLIPSLDADDQAVINPVRKLRLPAKEGALLFQKFHEIFRRLDADGGRHLPYLQLMKSCVPEIKIGIRRGIHVEIVMLCGNKGGLRVIGIVIIPSRLILHV